MEFYVDAGFSCFELEISILEKLVPSYQSFPKFLVKLFHLVMSSFRFGKLLTDKTRTKTGSYLHRFKFAIFILPE